MLVVGKRPTTLWTGCCIGSISAFITTNLILSKPDGQLQDAENLRLNRMQGISTKGNEGNKEENLRLCRTPGNQSAEILDLIHLPDGVVLKIPPGPSSFAAGLSAALDSSALLKDQLTQLI